MKMISLQPFSRTLAIQEANKIKMYNNNNHNKHCLFNKRKDLFKLSHLIKLFKEHLLLSNPKILFHLIRQSLNQYNNNRRRQNLLQMNFLS